MVCSPTFPLLRSRDSLGLRMSPSVLVLGLLGWRGNLGLRLKDLAQGPRPGTG